MTDKIKIWLKENLKGDHYIWIIVILLCVFSILVVYSAVGQMAFRKTEGNTEHFLLKHTMMVFACLVLTWFSHKIDYKWYWSISKVMLWLSPVLLLWGYFFGTKINDASRWITIPLINQSFQPSDFAKLALIMSLARMLAKRQGQIEDALNVKSLTSLNMQEMSKSMWPAIIWTAVICSLIALSNFSTAAMLFVTALMLMFIGRVSLRQLAQLVLMGGVFGVVAMLFGQRLGTTISRINSFLYDDTIPFQAEQSFIAIWRGGFWGLGPGQGIQKNFLPHSYSDFIYSTILEEWGMLTGIIVIFLYLALFWRSIKIVINSEQPFGGLLSAGLAISFVIQAFINMSVAVGLGPVTGQPLPLLSWGGTSLLFTGVSLGIILSISKGSNPIQTVEEEN